MRPCTARCSWVGVSHRPVRGIPARFALGVAPALAPPAPRCGGLRAPDLAFSLGCPGTTCARRSRRRTGSVSMRPSRLRRRPWTGGRMLTSTRCSAPAACSWPARLSSAKSGELRRGHRDQEPAGGPAGAIARYVRPEEREAFAREARERGCPRCGLTWIPAGSVPPTFRSRWSPHGRGQPEHDKPGCLHGAGPQGCHGRGRATQALRRLPGWSTCSRSQTRTRAPTSP